MIRGKLLLLDQSNLIFMTAKKGIIGFHWNFDILTLVTISKFVRFEVLNFNI